MTINVNTVEINRPKIMVIAIGSYIGSVSNLISDAKIHRAQLRLANVIKHCSMAYAAPLLGLYPYAFLSTNVSATDSKANKCSAC